jgi:hypothetical protein
MTEVDEETREQFQRIDDQFRRVINVIVEQSTATERRIDAFREDFRVFRDRVQTNFDGLYKSDEERRMEYQAIKAALSRVENSVHRLEAADLENRVAKLEAAARGDHHDA